MKKTISFLLALIMIAAAVAAIPVSAKRLFSDVAEDRWSASAIKYAVNNGYMNGVGDGKFDPSGSLTRGMVATVLWRREGSPAPAAPSGFEDVPAGKWYTDAIAWAKETGIVNGLTPTTFGPNSFITREQLATMLFRFASTAPVSVPERADLTPFPDGGKVSGWADEAMKWAVEAGLINGTNDGRLAPGGKATREQFAAIIERYDNAFKLTYRAPVLRSHYTEPEYPLVTDADFYVSTTGSDGNDGSFEHPFRTFEHAHEVVKEIPKTAETGGITVAFMAGNYGPLSVDMNWESGNPECPVTYCAYGDGDVIFDNGYNFTADSFVPIDESEKALFTSKALKGDKIKKTDMSSVIAPGTYDLDCYVYSDNALCTVARYPDKYEDGTDQLMKGAGYTSDETHIRITYSGMKNRLASYHTLDGVKLYGYLTTGWSKDTLSIGGYDPETGDVLISDPENARMGSLRYPEFPSAEFHESAILNASEELDAPGEYWVDPATSVMYVYDPKGDYHICGGGTMIRINYTSDITLRGLSFRNMGDYAVYGNRAHDITIDLCDFKYCGGMFAVEIGAHEPGRDLNFTMTRCDFDLMMDCCLCLSGGDVSEKIGYATHMNALIDNNSFKNYNLFLNEQLGIYITGCDEVMISHNEFINGGDGSVYYGGSQNVVMEYNYCKNQIRNASDAGVFCTWNDFEHRGNIVRYNLIDTVSSHGVGGFSAYLDDYSAGTSFYSNLLFNASEFVVHNGRDNVMKDNILINTDGSVSGFSVTVQQAVYMPETLGQFDEDDLAIVESWNDLFAKYEKNPALKAYAEEHWKEIFDLTTDLERWDDPNFVLARKETITNNRFINLKGAIAVPTDEYVVKYSTIEGNVGYTLDENPFFVNPSRGDYRFREGVGFPDIHFEEIGRY